MNTYYTLFVYDIDNESWHMEFGDDTRKSINEEIYHSYQYTKKKHLKIVKNDGSRESMDKMITCFKGYDLDSDQWFINPESLNAGVVYNA